MVGVPCFGDQGVNSNIISSKKIGIELHKALTEGPPPIIYDPNVKVETIVQVVTKVVEDDTYRKNIIKVKAICGEYRL